MLTDSDQRELLDFSASEPVVSLYLNTDPSQGNADAYRLRLRNLLKEANLPNDTAAIEKYFATQYNWSGRGVAVYSCAPMGFFRAYPLALSVRDQIYVGSRPNVKPLADLLDLYGGYGVVLVDKQGARLFSFHMGQLREQQGVLGEAVKHTKHGGASTRPGSRGGVAGQTQHEDEIVDRNMKDSAEFAIRFFEENRVRRVLIGGTDENVSLFRGMLPRVWQSLVMGTFAMPMTASHSEVLERAMQIGREAEEQHKDRLVERLITTTAKGEGAVMGLEAVLDSLADGRVHALLVSDGYHMPVWRCTGCGRMTCQKGIACRVCSSKLEAAPDGVELAVHAVLKAGGSVQVVHDSPALKEAGHIGAMLRY